MKIKRLVLLSLGVLGASMPFGAYAVNPIMPMAQQEQLQQDREIQQERNFRLDAERVGTVVSEPAPIDVPSNQNGASFFGSLSNVGVFTLRALFGTNHIYGWCHSFCSKVEYVL